MTAAQSRGPCVLLERADPPVDVVELLARRRSIRTLTDGPFPDELRARLAEAIRLTPAAYNLPPWRAIIIHNRRDAFWETTESAFRAQLTGDRLDRYLNRLAGFRSGLGAALFYEDLSVHAELKAAWSLTDAQAAAFIQQSLGMAQLSFWLALTQAGLVASLQHWDWLIERPVAALLGVDPKEHRLAVTMPFGYPVEPPRDERPIEPDHVIGHDRCPARMAGRQ